MSPARDRERRACQRWGVHSTSWTAAKARLLPGRDVTLVNISAGGALVDGPARLLPGTHVDLQLISGGSREIIRARVIRCAVSSLNSREGVRYRAALAFLRQLEDW